ncbi:MAG: CidA/LrgA family protein [Lachnospiraceae bacterium]|nr:CidA/LrgA family protein [Lachnospiraceae bacterium]
MKYVWQFLIILAFSFAGEVLHFFIPLPVPASIYGIVLLFLFLEFGILPEKAVAETGLFLVRIMPILFIPAVVGIMDSWDILQSSWLTYLITLVISTFVVMAVSGGVTQLVINRRKKNAGKEAD